MINMVEILSLSSHKSIFYIEHVLSLIITSCWIVILLSKAYNLFNLLMQVVINNYYKISKCILSTDNQGAGKTENVQL